MPELFITFLTAEIYDIGFDLVTQTRAWIRWLSGGRRSDSGQRVTE
jgi:hypothetical protein